jgi:hypothetical protein
MYYLRPQEWGSLFSKVRPVQLSMIMGVFALFTREKRVQASHLFKTPHDWAIVLFFLWVTLTSGAPYHTFKQIANLLVFYFVIVQTLNTVPRMRKFLGWWCIFILCVAALALLGEYGLDFFGSRDITHGRMKDRLILNLSIFANPNALAHSVVPAIPMLYFLMVWKRPIMLRNAAFLILPLPLWCMFLTQSKGSFLVGFVTTLATLTFGRPKVVQVAILVLGIGFGYGALYSLPRMNELNKSKTDEAIQGRVAAYTYGYRCVTTLWTGIGYGNWMTSFYKQSRRIKWVKRPKQLPGGKIITIRRPVPERYWKAAHGSYNQMGAELGAPGLMLFFLMVWCALRTLCFSKTNDAEEERVRRTLFVLVLTYLVSSWMIDFGYRPTFFMFTAATAAFHRHLRGVYREIEEEIAKDGGKVPIWKKRQNSLPGAGPASLPTRPGWKPAGSFAPALQAVGDAVQTATAVLMPTPAEASATVVQSSAPAFRPTQNSTWVKLRPVETTSEPEQSTQRRGWNRLGPVDFVVAAAITYAAIRFWAHILKSM